uniref:WH2 domain-containing protein n=1 Tax=Anopheles atroparvus TaxID=41427 RepID=A0AAG5DIK6_ANOAO
MSPPPPPPPPIPGSPALPLAPIPTGPAASPGGVGSTKAGGPTVGPDHNDQLMAAIRNGINLKPTKTNDRSTAGFIKRANGALDANGPTEQQDCHDKPCSMDEMKDALQAELRNTLKRKIKQQDQGTDDSRKNDEIERVIEHTRNEVQLKCNGPPADAGPKVDNPLKLLVDMVDKERGVAVAAPTPAPAVVKNSSPIPTQKAIVSSTVPTPKTTPPLSNGNGSLKKVSIGQGPVENGNSTKINVSTSPWKSTSPSMAKANPTLNGSSAVTTPVPNGNKSPSGVAATNGTMLKSPVHSGKMSNGSKAAPNPSSPIVATSAASKMNTSQTVKTSSPVGKGSSIPGGVVVTTNGGTPVTFKAPSYGSPASSSPVAKPGTYYNTLPRTFGASSRANAGSAMGTPKTAAPSALSTPPVFSSTVKISIGSFGDGYKPSANSGVPIVRNGAPSKIEPLTIEIASNSSAGSSTNGTSSPSTPKELLSPQVRSGAASIRPSQIRTLTKAGSVVSHTDIVETPRPIARLPVTLIEPVPVLTAAAAASPPPASPKMAPVTTNPSPAKERTALFEKASSGAKEAPKSPLNRWADSSSVSGGTARKLLLSHGRPNFTIKRSNSRQGFDVDVPDSRADTVKPVFRILTDLEKMETEQEQREQGNTQRSANGGQQQQYVSFAKDLSNAPNNHPDVAVVTKTIVKPSASNDPFLSTLKDIKIDIGEMKIVNAKDA